MGWDDTCKAVAKDCIVVASEVYGPRGLMYFGRDVVPTTPLESQAVSP